MSTVRIGSIAAIVGITKDPLNNQLRDKTQPWPDDFNGEGQRRFDGTHAVALVLQEMLRNQGFSVAVAGEFVRGRSGLIADFLDEVEAGRAPKKRFVMAAMRAVEDSWLGARAEQVWGAHSGDLEEVLDCVRSVAESVGRETETRKDATGKARSVMRIIGGPLIALAEVGEAYRLVQMRALAAGFAVDGRAIAKIEANAADGVDGETFQ